MNSVLPIVVATSFYRGRFDEAQQFIRRFVVSPSEGAMRLPANARAYQTLLEAAQGADPDSVADSLPSVSTRYKPDLQALPIHVVIAETGVLLRHPALSESRYDDLLELFQRGLLFAPGWLALLPRLLGAICILREQWSEAESHLERACDVADRAGALPELALAYLECADLQSRRPGEMRRSMALSHLSQAQRLLSKLGMVVSRSRLVVIEERLASGPRGGGGRTV
jgi:tetratricopeptide (TPR) repeat protein